MRVLLVCPVPRGSRLGNRVTALRWRRLLGELGHRATITGGVPRGRCDVLIAIHARHSAEAVRAIRERRPEQVIIVALTGTDLYRDILHDAAAQRSLDLADALVVLHDRATLALPKKHRAKARLVRQSAEPIPAPQRGSGDGGDGDEGRPFEIAFVAHLRAEKDPMRAALAARLLPAESRIRVLHVGRALEDELRVRAQAEQQANPRYQWLGEVSARDARGLVARAKLLVLTSRMEGGANVLGEAIVSGTPIVASRIPATVAALGPRYPGLFPVGDTAALAALMARAERDPRFLARLTKATCARRRLFTPAAEKQAWSAALRAACNASRQRERDERDELSRAGTSGSRRPKRDRAHPEVLR